MGKAINLALRVIGAAVVLFIAVALIWGPLNDNLRPTKSSADGTTPVPTVASVSPTATPTATNTPTPAASATAVPPTTTPAPKVAVPCPTDEEMRRALEFDRLGIKPVFTGEGIVWDPCKWNWQSNDLNAVPITLPDGWQATTTRGSDGAVQVWKGPAPKMDVRGFTLRFLRPYDRQESRWALDNCELLTRENAFGERRNPSYPTTNGNVSCASNPPKNSGSGSISKSWLRDNVGGREDKWTEPDWSGGAWVYKDKGTFVPMKYPGSGELTVWISGGPVIITSANASRLNGQSFDEASFKP